MLPQAEDAFRDDVEIDLAGATFDGVTLRAEPSACGFFGVFGKAVAVPTKAICAKRFDEELALILDHFRRSVFED